LIRLIGIDVDGTLVGTGGFIHPRIWEMTARACRMGIHLALCSGRPGFGVALEYAQRLESGGWHIFQNGASIVSLATGQSRSVPIPTSWKHALIERARSTGETLELYSDTAYVAESTSEWARDHAGLLGIPFDPRPLESLTQPVVRAQWLLTRDRARECTALPHPGLEVAQSSSPLMPDTQFVGLTREGVTKGGAIRSVAEEYGISMSEVMYVGDAGNALSALRIVGHPVAMGNADPAVIDAARYTVASVDEGGLAQAIERAVTHGLGP
jgi:Cof subfamily protein (haloacid dehalogenase superfamily)